MFLVQIIAPLCLGQRVSWPLTMEELSRIPCTTTSAKYLDFDAMMNIMISNAHSLKRNLMNKGKGVYTSNTQTSADVYVYAILTLIAYKLKYYQVAITKLH